MSRTRDPLDAKGLIHEAYRIDGIPEAECRSIFLDWALSLPDGQDVGTAINIYLSRHAADFPDHPMTSVLRQGLERAETPRRRGGWRSRNRD
ncbi:hypothetical protein [Roseovarius amoyensis]|uniref:hypothetical protein n=1 Tax=Roseovarius amoyensis TaxID=2211448 RepID=UPI000DBE106D|nr:hypothetical protein [Roseovarius amoyensis]